MLNKKNLKTLIKECMKEYILSEGCGDRMGDSLIDKAAAHREDNQSQHREDYMNDPEEEADRHWERLIQDLAGDNGTNLNLQVAKAFANNKELAGAALEMAKGMYDFQQEMIDALKSIEQKNQEKSMSDQNYPFGAPK